MATYTWTGGAYADWEATGVWSLAGYPGSAAPYNDIAIIPANSSVNLSSGIITVGTLEIAAGQTMSSFYDTGTFTTSVLDFNDQPGVEGIASIYIFGSFAITATSGGILDPGNNSEVININDLLGQSTSLILASSQDYNQNVFFYFEPSDISGLTPQGGIIEYQSFTPGEIIAQHISRMTTGDKIVFDGANFSADTLTWNGGTLDIYNSASALVLSLTGLSGPFGFSLQGQTHLSGDAIVFGTIVQVSSIADLNAAIVNANTAAANFGPIVITLTGNIDLSGTPLDTINLQSGVTLEIIGGGNTLNGGNQPGLVVSGAGTVRLSTANTYTGGTTISGGTLDLGNAAAAGSGPITFAPGSTATLKIEQGDAPANSIAGFLPGDTIDLAGIGLATAVSVVQIGTTQTLTVTGGNGGPVTLDLTSTTPDTFLLSDDGHGGTDIKQDVAPTITGVQTTESGPIGSVTPFGTVVIGSTSATQTVTASIALASGSGSFSNLGIGRMQGSSYIVAGTAAQDTAAIQALQYQPPGTGYYTIFELSANDGILPSTTTPTTTLTGAAQAITVTPVTNSVSTTDASPPVAPFTGVNITDPNFNQTETVSVTLDNGANGTLSDTILSDGWISNNGTLTTNGAASVVATALDDLRFTPTPGQATPGNPVLTTITAAVKDTALQTASISSTVTTTAAAPVNNAPTITGTQPNQTTVDYVPIKPFAAAKVADIDTGAQDSLTIVLKNSSGTTTDANGTLAGNGLTETSKGSGIYTLAATTPTALTAELQALTFTPTQHEVAAGKTVTTSFTLTANDGIATTTDSTTSVVVTALNYINGPANGFGVLIGTPGQDVITAHGYYNLIYANGGNDFINAGAGLAAVNAGSGNVSIVLGGSYNQVTGGNGNDSVTGAPGGYTSVTLGNGNNTVTIGGAHDVISLGNGANLVTDLGGMAFITTGSGNDTITVGGKGNTINAGAGSNIIHGGTGSDTFVLPAAGKGFDTITGFLETNADLLDLRTALGATKWNGSATTLGKYLLVTNDTKGDTTLSIATTGTGSGTAIAVLEGAGNLALADLLSHRSLLT